MRDKARHQETLTEHYIMKRPCLMCTATITSLIKLLKRYHGIGMVISNCNTMILRHTHNVSLPNNNITYQPVKERTVKQH